MPARFGYWNIKGRAHVHRVVLAYAGVDYQHDEYGKGGLDWFGENKFKLGLDYPNMPYYIDGDLKLTESGAILRYLGRKHDLYGSNDIDKARIDMVMDTAADLGMAMGRTVYNKDFEKIKADHFKVAEQKLKQLEAGLGDNDWFVGNKLSIADFAVYHVLIFHLDLCPDVVNKFPKLMAMKARIEAFPGVKEFLNSDKNYDLLYGPQSQFKPMQIYHKHVNLVFSEPTYLRTYKGHSLK